MKRHVVIFCIMGLLYLNMEVFARAIRGELLLTLPVKYVSFAGWTSLWMFFIGGMCGTAVGLLNELNQKIPVFVQSLLGALFIFFVEFFSGLLFNKALGLYLWDYSNWPLNILGQVTLLYLPLWFILCPFIIALDDTLVTGNLNKLKFNVALSYKRLFLGL